MLVKEYDIQDYTGELSYMKRFNSGNKLEIERIRSAESLLAQLHIIGAQEDHPDANIETGIKYLRSAAMRHDYDALSILMWAHTVDHELHDHAPTIYQNVIKPLCAGYDRKLFDYHKRSLKIAVQFSEMIAPMENYYLREEASIFLNALVSYTDDASQKRVDNIINFHNAAAQHDVSNIESLDFLRDVGRSATFILSLYKNQHLELKQDM